MRYSVSGPPLCIGELILSQAQVKCWSIKYFVCFNVNECIYFNEEAVILVDLILGLDINESVSCFCHKVLVERQDIGKIRGSSILKTI